MKYLAYAPILMDAMHKVCLGISSNSSRKGCAMFLQTIDVDDDIATECELDSPSADADFEEEVESTGR